MVIKLSIFLALIIYITKYDNYLNNSKSFNTKRDKLLKFTNNIFNSKNKIVDEFLVTLPLNRALKFYLFLKS